MQYNRTKFRDLYIKIFNIVMWIVLIPRVIHMLGLIDDTDRLVDWSTFPASEFLVNYQGGFVRRGLLGEGLFQLCVTTGINPATVIATTCILLFIGLTWWLVVKFQRYGIRWWILCSCFYLTMYYHGVSLIRKDLIMLCLIALTLTVYSRWRVKYAIKVWVVAALVAINMIIYEPSYFLFAPLMWIIMYAGSASAKDLRHVILSGIAVTALMGLISIYSGNQEIVAAIQTSWHDAMPQFVGEEISPTVESLSWSVSYALERNESILMPWCQDWGDFHAYEWLAAHLIFLSFGWYMITVYPFTCYKGNVCRFPCAQGVWSMLVIVELISNAPMFLGLSSDYGRIMMHIFVTLLMCAFILDRSIFDCLSRLRFSSLSLSATRFMPRSIYAVTLSLGFISIPYCWFGFHYMIYNSPIVGVFYEY